MNVRSLAPWNRNTPATTPTRSEAATPFLALHQQMNRLFDDVFRGFDLPAVGPSLGAGGWPQIEVSEKGDQLKITAELPGVEEKDVDVSIDEGVLCIRGEKRAEIEDRDRHFTERSYGMFERRIPLGRDIDEAKVSATFKNGVLSVTAPKSPDAGDRVKRIPINKEAGQADPLH